MSLWQRKQILPDTMIWISGQEQDGGTVMSFPELVDKLEKGFQKENKVGKSVAFVLYVHTEDWIPPCVTKFRSTSS